MHRKWMVTLALVLVGCGAKQNPDTAEESGLSIALTQDGLQPFPEGEITELSLSEVFEGYTVQGTDDGQVFAIRDGGDTVLVVEKTPDGYRAKVTGEGVAGPAGIRVGADFEKVQALNEVQCQRGAPPWDEVAFCTSSDLEGIVFAIDAEGARTPGCTSGCRIEDLSTLTGTKVDSIDWQP